MWVYTQIPQSYQPCLASVPYGNSGQVWATHLSNADDLALPLSIAWAGTIIAGEDCVGADVSGNGRVDLEDFAILESQWLEVPGIPSADIAPESVLGVVNLTDLAVVATYWLESGCI